jgi:two-component system, sensor histidine kinase and response regulator
MAKYDILLIGDGTNLLKTIGWVLDYKGFAVKATASPEAALEAMVKKNYDLVIARLGTDDMGSLDILKRARRLNPEVKIMAVSGDNAAIFPLEAYEIDLDDYILMPVSPPELWRRVSRCLENREVLDLQVERAEVASARTSAAVEPQVMLMSHDVRGAMVATAASLKLVARGTYGELSDEAKAKLREAAGRIENSIHLIEDSLGRSLADHQAATDEDVLNVSEDIVDPVLAELADEIQAQQITLVNRLHHNGRDLLTVRGSKLGLRSVFRNLISNGIKFGGQGCVIVVDCEMQGSFSRLTVYNTGQIVSEDLRSMLFSPVRSADSSKKRRQGMGLGLSLSRDIIQNYGGDIWYEAKKGGSNFVISLPQR